MNRTQVFLVIAFIGLVVFSDSIVFSQTKKAPPEKPKSSAAKIITDDTYSRAAEEIAYWEGFYPCPKADPVGHATIGYGHLLHFGPPTQKDFDDWGCISKKEGKKLLASELRRYDLPAVLAEYQIDLPRSRDRQVALVSFIYNLGVHVLDYGHGLRGALQKGRGVASQLRRYVYASDGEKMIRLPGLVRRREWEASLFAGAK